MLPPAEHAWDAWSPTDLFGRLRQFGLGWYIAGGWALDLWLGRWTRAHEDLEFCVLAEESSEFRKALVELEFFAARNGTLVHLPAEADVPGDVWQLWGADMRAGRWRVDMMLERGTPDQWVYKRDPSFSLPRDLAVRRSQIGIPFLAPILVLLFKARHMRDKDQLDFAAAVPLLDPVEKAMLRRWLEKLHSGHDWIAAL